VCVTKYFQFYKIENKIKNITNSKTSACPFLTKLKNLSVTCMYHYSLKLSKNQLQATQYQIIFVLNGILPKMVNGNQPISLVAVVMKQLGIVVKGNHVDVITYGMLL
jgi:hypothetical protein